MEYEYRAVSKDGQKTEGVKSAYNQVALARDLRAEGLFLVWAKERGLDVNSSNTGDGWLGRLSNSFDFLIKYIPLQEKVVFSRHLGLMVRAGFSLNKALDTLARQTKNKYFANVIKNVGLKVSAGHSFSDAISSHPDVFSPIFVGMMRVGEASGKLDETLNLVTHHLKREYGLKRKIRGAMTYPLVIITAMIGVGAVMMIFVLPQLITTFSELNVALPLSTRIIFGVSTFISQFWYLFIIFLTAAVYGIYFFTRKTKFGRKSVNFMLLKTPIFSDLTKKLNSARFARTLSSLLSGGVSLTESLRITSDALSNYFYKTAVAETVPEVEKGKPLSLLLVKYPNLFPPVVTEMTAVGEETGSLAIILKELARFFESEVSIATKSMSSIIEPVIMIIVGLAVGVFALSIIQPIYSIGAGL